MVAVAAGRGGGHFVGQWSLSRPSRTSPRFFVGVFQYLGKGGEADLAPSNDARREECTSAEEMHVLCDDDAGNLPT